MLQPPIYPLSLFQSRRDQEAFQVFLAEVLTVDWERKVCTIRDVQTGLPYQNVSLMPSNHSSYEGTDINMPEDGSKCCCAHIAANAGFLDVVILAWMTSDTNRAQQGISVIGVDDPNLQGWNKRVRGNYRKAYPGQRTVTNSHGYAERQDDGWDRQAADFSREYLDPDTRTWSKTTSREVSYSDARTSFAGPIVRPGAQGLGSETLPSGGTRQVVYLAPGATASDRYVSGKQDIIALVEKTEKIQEFALDHPVPVEVIGNSILDMALGTTADLWGRTIVSATGGVSFDDQSYPVTQNSDMPYTVKDNPKPVGPTTNEGPSPRRRGYIIERSEGTLVGSNVFDPSTYGKILKPVIFPYSKVGRFASNVNSGYLPVNPTTDHAETRVAASAYSNRFTHEGNTTRWDITKEGMLSLEIGSTLPCENIGLDQAGGKSTYEHPHGAGRSVEAHIVGSMKMVVGKNRDEEESIDLQSLGQMVLRLGADDTSLPNAGREIDTQIRGAADQVKQRTLQYWNAGNRKLTTQGDPGSLTAKTAGENVSLRGALDGGMVLRLGARSPKALRRHFMNGYSDGQGLNPWAVGDVKRIDSKSARDVAVYPQGDSNYAFAGHDMTQVGKPRAAQPQLPYWWSGNPVLTSNSSTPYMDQHGLSLDLHLVQDALVRIGKNPGSGQSLLMDLAGGMAAAFGKDNQGRSITASLDGGVELTIGPSQQGKALRIEFTGDVDWVINGHWHVNVTGDTVFESTNLMQIAKNNIYTKAQSQFHTALSQIIHEAPEIAGNQGGSITPVNS
jgi:hypothetical protein